MSAEAPASFRLPRLFVLGLLALGAAAAGHGLWRALSQRVPLLVVLGPLAGLLFVGLLAACAAVLAALAHESAGLWRGEPRPRPLAPLGALLVMLVATWELFLALVQPFQRLWFDFALALAAGAWAGLILLERAPPLPLVRVRRWAGTALVCASASLVLLELGLRAAAALKPWPLLVRVGEAPQKLIERFRCRPGQERFGFACNGAGYYDTEFLRRRPGERLVVSIGDSFNLGAVPHAWHYTSVCQEHLGLPVYNLGVPGVGPPEYLRLLVDDALPLDPDMVVVCLFVGNDLTYAEVDQGLPDRALRRWLEREQVLSWVLPRRLARIAAERSRQPGQDRPAAGVQGERSPSGGSERAAQAQAFPWLADPKLEQGSLSEASFLRLETQRALEICARDPVSLASACARLGQAQAAAGSSRMCVLLIPDEFQVEDELWQAVLESAGRELERDRPQRLLGDWFARQGIPFLDLLPALRAVAPLEDGRRHLYHLRDTHFNARGNDVAGQALAQFLEARMAR